MSMSDNDPDDVMPSNGLINNGHIELSSTPYVPMPDRFTVPVDLGETVPGTWDNQGDDALNDPRSVLYPPSGES